MTYKASAEKKGVHIAKEVAVHHTRHTRHNCREIERTQQGGNGLTAV